VPMLQRARLDDAPRAQPEIPTSIEVGEMVGIRDDGDGEETAPRSSFHLSHSDHFPEKEMKMSHQNWEMKKVIENDKTFLVKINVEIGDALFERKLGLKMKDAYPWVIRPAIRCLACARSPCVHGKPEKFLMPLHVFVWVERNGFITPEPNGRPRVIHHKNEDKCDARIKNLALGTQSAHAKLHNSKRRKYGRRKRQSFNGLFRPHQPAQVIDVPEEIKKTLSPPPVKKGPKTLTEKIYELEEVLRRNYEFVLQGTAYLEGHGTAIPRSASAKDWRKPQTRLLGLRMPRMACSEAEACFVRLYASFDLELGRVADDLGEPVHLLRHLLNRVAVAVAVDRWVKHRRLPTKTVKFGFEEVKLQSRRRVL
jgi:hypothetical protein